MYLMLHLVGMPYLGEFTWFWFKVCVNFSKSHVNVN